MFQPDNKSTYTIVAFRYDRKNSVLYRTVPEVSDISLLIYEALNKHKADVISIRRVYEKQPVR